MLASSGTWTYRRAYEDAKKREMDAAKAERRKHRSLSRFERLCTDLERIEGRIRKAHTITSEKYNVKRLLRQRNRIVDMLNEENRKAS